MSATDVTEAQRCAERERMRRVGQEPWVWWRDNRPVALLSLERHDQAVSLIFEGLKIHWLDMIASGRREEWANAVRCSGNLLASIPEAPYQRHPRSCAPPATVHGDTR